MKDTTHSAMHRRMIALDLDGTLVPDGTGDLPDTTREVVADVVAAGHDVVVATGRSLVGALPIATALGLNGSWIVASNGAVTARVDQSSPGGYRIETCQTLEVEPLLHLARQVCPTVRVAVEEVGWGYHVSDLFPKGQINGRQFVVSDDELCLEPVPRVVLAAPDAAEVLLEPVRSLGVIANVAGPHWLDVTPPGTSKASALESVRRTLDVASERTVFIGDGTNDLPAMAWAARSYAMGHAPRAVQAAADYVTGTLAEHGAALALLDLLAQPVTIGVSP
ncbi:HAD family hydrolase [Streptomyces griseoincarnatus]|uniref:HAD family hydrolase n=1 Tax=Promicromonospora sp. NPDC057138 TaxID=3346031 RepID=UPI003645956D